MKKQIKSLLAMILAAVMLLSACGSDEDINTDVTEAPATQAVASGTPADITAMSMFSTEILRSGTIRCIPANICMRSASTISTAIII